MATLQGLDEGDTVHLWAEDHADVKNSNVGLLGGSVG